MDYIESYKYKSRNLEFVIERNEEHITLEVIHLDSLVLKKKHHCENGLTITHVSSVMILPTSYQDIYLIEGRECQKYPFESHAKCKFNMIKEALIEYSNYEDIETDKSNVLKWLESTGGDFTLGYNTAEKTYMLYKKSGGHLTDGEFYYKYGRKVVGMYGVE